MTVITYGQYHALVASVIFTLVLASAALLAVMLPRHRRPGQLPWGKWGRRVPRRHAAVLAVLRDDYRDRPGEGLPAREVERRSGSRCAPVVLRRLMETGWAERTRHPGITPYHMDRAGWVLTETGWTGTARVLGAHLPGEVEALQDYAAAEAQTAEIEGFLARGRHASPGLPEGHPSGPDPVIPPISLTAVRRRD